MIFWQGYDAYKKGLSWCPYVDGTVDAQQWWNGWYAAQSDYIETQNRKAI